MPQQVEVNEAVGIGVKNVPTSIAALSYMMRNVQGDNASQTSHGRHKISEKLENVPSVPRFPWKTSRLSPGFLMLSGNLGTLVTQFEIVVEIELIATCLPDCLRPPQGRRLSA